MCRAGFGVDGVPNFRGTRVSVPSIRIRNEGIGVSGVILNACRGLLLSRTVNHPDDEQVSGIGGLDGELISGRRERHHSIGQLLHDERSRLR